jgi:hypothetical protein
VYLLGIYGYPMSDGQISTGGKAAESILPVQKGMQVHVAVLQIQFATDAPPVRLDGHECFETTDEHIPGHPAGPMPARCLYDLIGPVAGIFNQFAEGAVNNFKGWQHHRPTCMPAHACGPGEDGAAILGRFNFSRGCLIHPRTKVSLRSANKNLVAYVQKSCFSSVIFFHSKYI